MNYDLVRIISSLLLLCHITIPDWKEGAFFYRPRWRCISVQGPGPLPLQPECTFFLLRYAWRGKFNFPVLVLIIFSALLVVVPSVGSWLTLVTSLLPYMEICCDIRFWRYLVDCCRVSHSFFFFFFVALSVLCSFDGL